MTSARGHRLTRAVAVLATASIAASALVAGVVGTTPGDVFDTMRERWRTLVVGAGEHSDAVTRAVVRADAEAASAWFGMNPSGTTELWGDLDTDSPVDRLEAFRRVSAMARAWAAPNGVYASDPRLLASTLRALDRLTSAHYHAATKEVPAEWWYQEIGIPLEVLETAVLLGDRIGDERLERLTAAVERFTPAVARTAANRTWTAIVVVESAILREDADAIDAAMGAVAEVFDTVETGDGFHVDGSFLQHGVHPYTGGYGLAALDSVARLAVLVGGTPWQLDARLVSVAVGWVENAYQPFLWHGVMMDAVRGREISREYTRDGVAGAHTIASILLLAESSEPDAAAELRGIAARELGASSGDDFWVEASPWEIGLAERAMRGNPAPELDGIWAFPAMDRIVMHRAGTAVAIAMSSSRIASYESLSGENVHGWYTAEGTVYTYVGSSPYGGDFWPTVDPYRMPGTTVDTVRREDAADTKTRSSSDFAGVLSGVGGSVGVAAMRLDATSSELTADKAWFMFDDEVVALGSSIDAPEQPGEGVDGRPRHVETTVEDRPLGPGDGLAVDGVAIADGEAVVIPDAAWAHVGDAATGVGYVFPGGADVTVRVTPRSGAWSDINERRGSSEVRTERYADVGMDHGVAPEGAGYAYVMLPGASRAATAAYSLAPDIRILAQSADASAVEERALDAVAVSVWNPEGASVERDGRATWLTTDAACLITVERDGDDYLVSLADPTQAHEGVISLTLELGDVMAVADSSRVRAQGIEGGVRVEFDVSGMRGAALTARLRPVT